MGSHLSCWKQGSSGGEELKSNPAASSNSPIAVIFTENEHEMCDEVKDLYTTALNKGPHEITTIEIANTELGVKGSEHLSYLFPELSELKEVFLDSNAIGPEGAMKLSNSLAKVESLERLTISNNQLGDQGLEVLAPTFAYMRELRSLVLCSNELTRNGLEELSNSLPELPLLRTLDVRGNSLGRRGLRMLVQAVTGSKKLRKFLLDLDNLDEETLDEFQSILPEVRFGE